MDFEIYNEIENDNIEQYYGLIMGVNIPTQKCTLTGRFEHSVRLTSAR